MLWQRSILNRVLGRRFLPLRCFSIQVQPSRPQTDIAEYFHFTKVVVASHDSLGGNFAKFSLRHREPREPINVEKAKQQHRNYVNELRKLIGHVVVVPAREEFPDQVFVEDPAVVLDGVALLTNMRSPTRAGEGEPMRSVLESLDLHIVPMTDPNAYLDGGDVIFTGREFLVGLSKRTNKEGVESLARAFPQWPVTAVRVKDPVLHLKSMCSMAGIDLVAISETAAGITGWKDIEQNAHFKYQRLGFPDNNGANCLFINGIILHPPKEEYPESYKVWERLECPKIAVPNSELAKADGSLTCNSVRIS